LRGAQHLRRNRVEPELGTAEHPERPLGVNIAPVEVDEPAARRSLDVRAAQVRPAVGGAGRGGVERPGRARRVTGYETEQLAWLAAALHGDVDVAVPAWRRWSRAAAA